MPQFSTAREAQEFLVARIVAEAQRENVALSEVERKMLYFTESGWTLPDIMDINAEFDRQYDQDAYEKKIAHLIRKETRRLRKENPAEYAMWATAARRLKKEDHYISVMIDEAGVPSGAVSDGWKTNLLLATVICLLIAGYALMHHLGVGTIPKYAWSNYGSYTVNVPLNKFIGYVWLTLFVAYICGVTWAHFDPERRFYKFVDRIFDPFDVSPMRGLKTKKKL